MTAPPCDPATLGAPCAGGCGRRLHHARPSHSKRPCTLGHPVNNSKGLCPGCYTRHRRATANTPAPRHHIDLGWQQGAACAGTRPEQFFPDIAAGQNAAALVAPIAERFCAACPVQAACDRYAEATKSVGLWAGVWRRYRGSSYTRTTMLRAAS